MKNYGINYLWTCPLHLSAVSTLPCEIYKVIFDNIIHTCSVTLIILCYLRINRSHSELPFPRDAPANDYPRRIFGANLFRVFLTFPFSFRTLDYFCFMSIFSFAAFALQIFILVLPCFLLLLFIGE